jgi:hypothetical protein
MQRRKMIGENSDCLLNMSTIAVVNQILMKRQTGGRIQVLVQWAVSWASAAEMQGQAVSQIMGTRVRNDVTEFLINWSCSWVDLSDELMAGDLWQPFLDQEAKDEADRAVEVSKEEAKVKKAEATKRKADDDGADVRRSLRKQNKQ